MMNSYQSVFSGIALGLTVILLACYVLNKEAFIPILVFFILIILSVRLLLKPKK
jgi:hypothetical protein